MDQTANPYRPGAGRMPVHLAGRDAEVSAVLRLLREAAETGWSDENPWSFIGPRGLGKTALLSHLRGEARSLGYAVADVSCATGEPVVTEVARRVASALRRLEHPDGRAGRPDGRRARLEDVRVELGVPGVVKGAATARVEPESTPTGMSSGDLTEYLRDAAGYVRSRGGAGLVLCVDEVHVVERQNGGGIWMNAMQNLSADPVDPVITLCAGLPSTPRRLEAAATFAERFTYLRLHKLDRAATAEALSEPASQLGTSWSAQALSLAFDLTGGYPYFVQELGRHTWRAAAPGPGDRIAAGHVSEGRQAMRETLGWFFGRRWAACTDQERALLSVMVSLGGEDVRRGAIADGMGRSTQEISVARANLIERGLIEAAGHGRLSFALPGFARYARERVEGTDDDADPGGS